jgi:hypothetical protein
MTNSILSSTGPPKLIVDSGSRGTYVSISCPVVNKRLTNNPKRIQIPDGKIMTSTHEAELDYPELRPAARAVDIVPALHDYSLLSVGNLCDADYLVIFDKHEVRVMDNDLVVMRGHLLVPRASCAHIQRAVPRGTSLATLTLESKPMRKDANHRSQQ